MDSADLLLISKHAKARPARKIRKKPCEKKTTVPSHLDEQENRLHREAVASSLDDEQKKWFATQAVLFLARGEILETMVGIWTFPYQEQRYGVVESDEDDSVEYCIVFRPQGGNEFIRLSMGIVKTAEGEFVQAQKNPILGDEYRGFVMRIVSIEKNGEMLPSVSNIAGFLSEAFHMSDVIGRQYTSSETGPWATGREFGVARRRSDKAVLDRILKGEALDDDIHRWSKHLHPWDVAEAIETNDVDTFVRKIQQAVEDVDLDEGHVVSLESIPMSNIGVMPCIWAVQRGNKSTWIPRSRLFIRYVDDQGFQMLPIA